MGSAESSQPRRRCCLRAISTRPRTSALGSAGCGSARSADVSVGTSTCGSSTVVGVDDLPSVEIAGLLLLSSNPAHGNVHFAYRSAHDGHVEVGVHDIVGRLIARPVRAYQFVGEQCGVWNGGRESGERAETRAYFLRVTLAGQPIRGRKLVLVQ